MSENKAYDSNFCGSIPVHQINLIQPYGYLIVLDKKDYKIVQASENIKDVFGIAAEELVGTLFIDLLDTSDKKLLNDRFEKDQSDNFSLRLTTKHKKNIIIQTHAKPDYLIIEAEQTPRNAERLFTDVFQDLSFSMSAINGQTNLAAVCEAAVQQLQRISGFDSVLLYRFDEDWNGTVIAEVVGEGMTSYKGLKFPASDIPKQVRQLYLTNPFRMIPQREYTPIRLYPVINPVTHSLIDLSDCNLRSVAGVHIEYMRNMDIKSSMSIRIIKDEQLWGLISCHHKTDHFISYEVRASFELLSNVISQKIASILDKEEYTASQRMIEVRSKLIDQIYAADNWMRSITSEETNLLTLLNSTGAAIVYKGRMVTIGDVPAEEDVNNLIYWLQAKNIKRIYSVASLSAVNEYAVNYIACGSGIIVLPIDTDNGDFIIGFRPEVIRSVEWGGNPNEAIQFEPDKKHYHPRNSFQKWKEEVKNTAIAWNDQELAIAEDFRSYVFEYLVKK